KNVEQYLVKKIKKKDIVVFAGKLPPGTDRSIYQKWVPALQKQGVEVFLDAQGEALSLAIKKTPFLIKPNQKELEELVGKENLTFDETVQAGKRLSEHGIKKVVISMGETGALFIDETATLFAQAPKVPVLSTVGAGDGMVAACVASHRKERSLLETAKWAIATSAATVMQPGTQPAFFHDIQKLYSKVKVSFL
ncbi:MAG: 1-phosphofructokinase, partial [Clostridiales bacterium]|nr:1-phosphofructokinase [Clostridiales bacterium]